MAGQRSTKTGYTIFIDDGGVMNDSAVRFRQWQRLVAEYLAPRLGGPHAAWAEANRVVAERQFAEWEAKALPSADFLTLWRQRDREWLVGMCDLVGVKAPQDEACLRLAHETLAYVTRRVRAAYPGVVEALRALNALGYALHTASGEASKVLEGYLEGMGVRQLFGRLYGPDLVNIPKLGPRYYVRIFADAGVAPSKALVIDDSPRALAWAAEAGARTVLVSGDGQETGADFVIGGLTELPTLFTRL